MSERILVAMSGGVDSSVAAARFVDAGSEVIGVTLHLWEDADGVAPSRCCAPEDIRDARRVADQLGFPHYSFDRREPFLRTIVEPFVDAYLSGRTPSPCAACNQLIKIPALIHVARLMGARAIATGHYARIGMSAFGPRVKRGTDRRKDQSYFLGALDASTLSKLRLPLGGDTKEQVRREAMARGLVGAHKGESQDLCFVQNGGYARFVEERAPDRVRPGWITDSQGKKLAPHRGVHRFTMGQRKGLGVAVGYPVFVSRIDPETGIVVVEEEAAGRIIAVGIERPVFAAGIGLPMRAFVQVRYRDAGTEATLERATDGSLRMVFDSPIRAASAGQFSVAYVEEEVVAAGVISMVER